MYEIKVDVDIFEDIQTKKKYKKGDKFVCDKKRAKELINKGICKFVAEKQEEKQEKTSIKQK